MNNKRLGTEFEQEVCKILAEKGFWVHFLSPDNTGAQPFDVIAVKDGIALAIDCKTSSKAIFPFSRLEDNQVFAFEKWVECGNAMPFIAVKYKENIAFIKYDVLKENGKVDLEQYFNGGNYEQMDSMQ